MTGTIKESMTNSHHLPIFQISTLTHDESNSRSEANVQYYDFCNSNIENFVLALENTLCPTENCSFSNFVTTYKSALDSTCKLKVPKVSKRNSKTNPWITDGIIASVKTESTLYKNWVKSKNPENPNGDIDKYNKFSSYRKRLKK